MNCSIVIFPGSNCDKDIANSIECVTKTKPNLIWYQDKIPKKSDLIVLPGGFSFGDYLRSGAIASKANILSSIRNFSKRGVPIIGICNGFQILTEADLLPGTLILNNSLKFICKSVNLLVTNSKSCFTNKFLQNDVVKLPIAHKMGSYQIDKKGLKYLIDENKIVFRYCSNKKECNEINNPNGSIYNIAAVLSKNNKILGMMPHPERFYNNKNKDMVIKKILQSMGQ